MNNPIVDKLAELAKVQKTLPRKVAVVAVNFSKDRFRQQNWINGAPKRWQPRKLKTKKKSDNRAILVQSGRLRRSIRATSVTGNQIVIATDVPYAQVHNEGGTGEVMQKVGAHSRQAHSRKAYTTRDGRKVEAGTVKGHTVRAFTRKRKLNIPKRQFIGPSEALNKQVGELIKREFDNAMK